MKGLGQKFLFAVFTVLIGAFAGAFTWAFFFLMNWGIGLLWNALPSQRDFALYPVVVCIAGGVVIGLFEKRFGPYPQSLNVVMAQVKAEGRY